MTQERRYGSDTPFGTWLRSRPELESHQHAFTANDADWIFHRYKTHVGPVATRSVHCLMMVEVKTRLAEPSEDQRETLFLLHQCLCANDKKEAEKKETELSNWKRIRSRRLRKLGGMFTTEALNYGFFVLRFDGLYPYPGCQMLWGSFEIDGRITYREIKTLVFLEEVLKFDRHPRTFEKNPLRLHHLTSCLDEMVTFPMGITTNQKVITRS